MNSRGGASTGGVSSDKKDASHAVVVNKADEEDKKFDGMIIASRADGTCI